MKCFSSNIFNGLILFNFALFLCLIFVSDTFCLKSSPSASFSSDINITYINLSFPFNYMGNHIKRAMNNVSRLPFSLPSANFKSTTDKPSLNIEASKTTIMAGDSFSINCSASYIKHFTLVWHTTTDFSDSRNTHIKSSIEKRNSSFFRFSELTVAFSTFIDAGIYTCEMVEEKVSTSINISVVTKEGSSCEKNNDCYSYFLLCINGVCRCENGTFFNNVVGLCFGIKSIYCEKDIDCYHNVTNMICNRNKCICEKGYGFFHSPEESHGSCISYVKHGSQCKWNGQCKTGDENMLCRAGVCDCDPAFIYLNNERCYKKAKKMYDSCEFDGQCFDINARAICSRNKICICQYGYYYNSWTCLHQEEAERSKAQQVYRTAMIAAACFMISVVSIFVICIVKKSFCGNNTSGSTFPGWQTRSGNQVQRMTSINIEETVVADKPPSYDEVMLTPCTPPPNYTDILKLFPITEGLQRHNSEPRLSAPIDLGANRNRANSFHMCENSNSATNEDEATLGQHTPPPPKYEPPSKLSRPSLHLDIPVITVSFASETEDVSVNDEYSLQNHETNSSDTGT